jgi:hypothetical protein
VGGHVCACGAALRAEKPGTDTDLPVAWQVESANVHESMQVASLLDTLARRGFDVDTCAMDKGYDNGRVYRECEDRDVRPIISAPRDSGREARRGPRPDL